MEPKTLKRVLIITYYWPPAGGPGVQRWLKFVKYLREFGVDPLVYVPENPSYPLLDQDLIKEVPEDITVFKHPVFEPYSIASVFSKKGTEAMSSGLIKEKEQGIKERLLLWIRGNLFIPDARRFWIHPSVKFLEPLLEQKQIDTVVTTGPPHSLHLIGLKLQKETKVKWIADFRDPWTSIGYHKKLKLSRWAAKKHKQLEKKVLKSADIVLATSHTTAKELEGISGRGVKTLTNGFDTADTPVEVGPSSKFRLAHIGSLLTGRDPKILWEVLGELVETERSFKDDLEINLVGAVSEEVLQSVKNAGLEPFLFVKGYVSHDKALQLQREARVLLLLEIDSKDTRGIIPGKLFEYMAARRPVLAIGPENWEAGELLAESRAGAVFTYKEKQPLKEAVIELYRNYKNGTIFGEETQISQYTRKALTEKLATIIKDI
ncbi:glycosyltransferase family 4 protein [Robertkochia flava]|uniref:glycosyltransferase family 4 protein n=1 Tax=Robertkochia flava TaxID=3447986 RepID=UPI001CCD36ED|nr:glycosyltransferase family 4 protein [Robertkochia marina]